MDTAFSNALRAAEEVEEDPEEDPRKVLNARRAAAEAALRKSISEMGVNVSNVSIPPPTQQHDLAALATPLQAEGATTSAAADQQ